MHEYIGKNNDIKGSGPFNRKSSRSTETVSDFPNKKMLVNAGDNIRTRQV